MSASVEPGWAARELAAAHVVVEGPLLDQLTITGTDGHHLARVRRLRVGELVTAADGAGRWRTYRVERVSRGSMTIGADGAPRMEPCLEPSLAVAFALTKSDKPETVVARLTELGVDRIAPVIARRSIVRWDDARARAAAERFRVAAHEAAMQSRRARVPVVEPVADIGTLAGRPGLVVADPEGGPPDALPHPGPGGWLLVVGPEGGLDEAELGAFGPVLRLGVGPHVLRAETAAVAAAAALTGLRRAIPREGGHGG
ncbi:MAG: RsmE family RNA methyltransferase [Acidimicrobiia bacterium]